MRKAFLLAAVLTIGSAGQAASGAATPKQVLKPAADAEKDLPLSPGLAAGDLVFVSGQGGRDPKTGQQPASYDDMVRKVIENVRSVLQTGGLDLKNAFSCHAYFDDLYKRPQMNPIYGAAFHESPPKRTAVGVAGLPNQNQLELTCIAAKDFSAINPVYRDGVPGKNPASAPAFRVGDLVFTSGTGAPRARENDPIEDQMKATLDSYTGLLKGADLGFKDVVWGEIYTDDARNVPAIERTWATYFPQEPKPAKAIQVVSLAGAHMEITLVAAMPSLKPRAVPNGGVLAGKTLFLSPISAPGASIEEQVNGTIKKMKASLAAAGMKLTDVVSTEVALKDIADYARMNAAYRKQFGKSLPARTTIALQPSNPAAAPLVEISGIAIK